ncbi:uncharacterized protein LOC752732 [Strongylocentrotus purpuratus]|uniref:Uncharacterized protein n=1 Tax=Strongylocentrotus purpuratus TaxID=7668 RepID=A0A7M7NBT8_STRPU|nr:uncharacterized protein LOC752732 [Strongylocentrotus purpuratus]
MAMEKQSVLKETHHRSVTALGYHPLRREIVAGFEDGFVKMWEVEGYKLSVSTHEHQGWVTDFLYWPEAKVMFSSSNDGTIIAWSTAAAVHDHISFGSPVYSMALNVRRHQLVCGFNACIRVFSLDENRESGHLIDLKYSYNSKEHTDIVKCIVCLESRVYSAGFDQKLIIYDSSSYPGNRGLNPVFCNPKAHEAGISCLVLIRDSENNTWLVTGSFDKVVKIWSQDGKLTHRLDGFLGTINDLCYVPKNKTLWISSGTSPVAALYDPKCGENVSEFIGTFQDEENEKYHLQHMKYIPELNQAVASSSRRHILMWKYNPQGCITTLKCKHAVECLTYTKKDPILFFDGGSDGQANNWERLQTNHFMYSQETFLLTEAKTKLAQLKNEKREERRPLVSAFVRSLHNPSPGSYSQNKPSSQCSASTYKHSNSALLKSLFVESLDLLLLGSEDGNIYIWGFDDAAVNALRDMKPSSNDDLLKKYRILLANNSTESGSDNSSEFEETISLENPEIDSVTNRVAGFVCKNVLSGHSSCVTSMFLVGRQHGYGTTYLVSSGWDRRICIWDLESGSLVDRFRNVSEDGMNIEELACDGIVTDMDYSLSRNEFACASGDKMVYIRHFSQVGSEMTLRNTLQGHEGEVTQVTWCDFDDNWITSSEDGTIRLWSGDGMTCEQVINTHGPVSAICLDSVSKCIVAGVHNVIKVYNPSKNKLLQTNFGHTDSIRSIIHVHERNQYISGSWDGTLRVWNAYRVATRKKKAARMEEKRESISSFKNKNQPNYLIEDEQEV